MLHTDTEGHENWVFCIIVYGDLVGAWTLEGFSRFNSTRHMHAGEGGRRWKEGTRKREKMIRRRKSSRWFSILEACGLDSASACHMGQPDCFLPALRFLPLLFYFYYIGLVEFPSQKVFRYCIIFVCMWQLLSNHRVTRLRRFVLQITSTISYFLSIFNVPCMCTRFNMTENLERFLDFEVN